MPKIIQSIDEYETELQRHDWDYRYSDASNVYADGKNMEYALMVARSKFDPHGELWSKYDPKYKKLKDATK